VLFVISVLPLLSQEVSFSRRKSLEIMQELDSFLVRYNTASSINDGFLSESLFEVPLLTMFTDTSVVVFDDVNPHMPPGREDLIIEKRKSIASYIRSTRDYFETLDSDIKWTDAGNAIKRVYREGGRYYIPVTIRKDLKGYTTDEDQYYIHTNPELKMLLTFTDSSYIDLKISSLDKAFTETPDWECTPPEIPQKKVETIFAISPVATYLYSTGYDTYNDVIRSGFDFSGSNLLEKPPPYELTTPLYGVSSEVIFKLIVRRGSRRSLSISPGIGGGWYSAVYQLNEYVSISSNMVTDQDGDRYYHITESTQISEKMNIFSASFPLYFHLETWKLKKPRTGRYIRLGGKLSYTLPIRYTAEPDIYVTNTGYYPDYNVVLRNMPEALGYGFSSDPISSQALKGEYSSALFGYSVNFGFGRVKRSKSMGTVFYFGLDINVCLNDMTQDLSEDRIFGSQGADYNGILSEMNDARLIYTGIYFGIRKGNKKNIHLREKEISRVYPIVR